MKLFIVAFLLGSNMALAQQTYLCGKGKAPTNGLHDTFTLLVEGGQASIKYRRHAFFGSEELPALLDIPGCGAKETSTVFGPSEIYVECLADGDAGYLSLDLTQRPLRGELVFPEGNIGYAEDTAIKLICLQRF